MDSANEENSEENRSMKKSRGPATAKKLSKLIPGERIKVSYNSNGQPIGAGKAPLASYIGVLTKAFVPISYKDWHNVPKSLKSKLWSAIQVKFDVDPNTQKKVLASMSKSWRSYKYYLTSWIYRIKAHPQRLRNPPPKYAKYIEQSTWEEFVRQRLCEKFETLSVEQSKRRSAYIYNHRLSKKGYAGLMEDMEAKDGPSYKCDMSMRWAMARERKGGGYDEPTQKMVDKMDALRQQAQDGSLVPEGYSDVLTLALGTPEHAGRVRGLGHGVTPTTYFNLPKCGSRRNTNELVTELQEEKRKNKELEAQILKLQSQQSSEKVASTSRKSGEKVS